MHMRAVYGVGLIVLLWCSPAVYSQDLTTLKATFNAEINGINSRDLNAVLASVDEQMILFGIFSPFPIKGKDGFRQTMQEYFADNEHAVFTPIDPDFKVIGATGVAWGNFRLVTKQKNGPSQYSDGRYMFTYAQAEGKWVLISRHTSLLAPLVH